MNHSLSLYSVNATADVDYMEHLKRVHHAKEADIERTKKLYEEQQRQWQEQHQQATAFYGTKTAIDFASKAKSTRCDVMTLSTSDDITANSASIVGIASVVCTEV